MAGQEPVIPVDDAAGEAQDEINNWVCR
jgi:hypothetical protein